MKSFTTSSVRIWSTDVVWILHVNSQTKLIIIYLHEIFIGNSLDKSQASRDKPVVYWMNRLHALMEAWISRRDSAGNRW